jgi:non-homologous end joining protein Ku
MEMIEEKAKMRPPSTKPVPQRTMSNVVDLVSVLQESLRKQATGAATATKKPKAAARAKSTAALVKQRRRAA